VQLEKEVFYPRILTQLGDDVPEEVIDDQHEEETDATEMLEELVEMGVEDEEFDDKFAEFRDMALHHAEEVEEGQLFPLLEQKLDKSFLQELGAEMEKRHKELHRQLEAEAR
jgi:hypothetical protein